MISSIRGTIASISEGRLRLAVGPLILDLMVPASDVGHWSVLAEKPAELHTLLILDSQNQGASFSARLLGFRSPQDRAFFELFTTVKGIGPRKALKSFALPSARIARAIADRDLRTLQSLPEIGKRLAETIIAELHGKVDAFAAAQPAAASDSAGSSLASVPSSLAQEAVAVLMTLGEQRFEAVQLVDRALALEPAPADVESLVTTVYRIRGT